MAGDGSTVSPSGSAMIERGYALCEAETWRLAGNFRLGIGFLPPERRRALSAVYWFSHQVDDAVDGEGLDGEAFDGAARLRNVAHALEQTLAGDPPRPEWAALADATSRFAIPAQLYRDLVDGVARDLDPVPFADWEALRGYCYGVASTVGLIALRIFGGSGREAERAAEELGYALQLTNILRDLREDAARGRWYLPLDDCDRFGVSSGSVAAGRAEPGFDALVRATAERARSYYAAGPRLHRRLPRATRACPAALAGVYRALLERIAARPQVTLAGRVTLGGSEKAIRGLAAGLSSLWA